MRVQRVPLRPHMGTSSFFRAEGPEIAPRKVARAPHRSHKAPGTVLRMLYGNSFSFVRHDFLNNLANQGIRGT
jgi:hypothetical protein